MRKKCTKCGNTKNVEEFSWKVKGENIRHSVCKTCKREIDNTYYQSSKKRRMRIRKRAKASYEFLKLYVQRLKKMGCCTQCNDKRWYVLDFHHLSDKTENINELLRRGSIEKIKKEIRKCVLLCSNCHREHHYLKLNGVETNSVEVQD